MKRALWLPLLVTAVGCSQVSRELHPWQSRGDAFSFWVDTNQWTLIESRHLGRVAPEHVHEACDLLKEADAVEIAPDRARQMCLAAQLDFAGQLKPFLIRGVSYGTPFYSIVKTDKQSGWVYFFQATYDGEIYFPGVRYSPESAPIVILLRKQPARVIAVADIGGDRIFRGVDFSKTWK